MKKEMMIKMTASFFEDARKRGVDDAECAQELAKELGVHLACVPLYKVTERMVEKLEAGTLF